MSALQWCIQENENTHQPKTKRSEYILQPSAGVTSFFTAADGSAGSIRFFVLDELGENGGVVSGFETLIPTTSNPFAYSGGAGASGRTPPGTWDNMD